jgi:hypothetical protein
MIKKIIFVLVFVKSVYFEPQKNISADYYKYFNRNLSSLFHQMLLFFFLEFLQFWFIQAIYQISIKCLLLFNQFGAAAAAVLLLIRLSLIKLFALFKKYFAISKLTSVYFFSSLLSLIFHFLAFKNKQKLANTQGLRIKLIFYLANCSVFSQLIRTIDVLHFLIYFQNKLV